MIVGYAENSSCFEMYIIGLSQELKICGVIFGDEIGGLPWYRSALLVIG
jgi:hypothetical protein